jgi:hypothetical protein
VKISEKRWQLQQRIELKESLELAVGRIVENKWQERNYAEKRRLRSVLQRQ